MGRCFIGIEPDPVYLRIATRRIALAKLGQIYVAEPPEPETKRRLAPEGVR